MFLILSTTLQSELKRTDMLIPNVVLSKYTVKGYFQQDKLTEQSLNSHSSSNNPREKNGMSLSLKNITNSISVIQSRLIKPSILVIHRNHTQIFMLRGHPRYGQQWHSSDQNSYYDPSPSYSNASIDWSQRWWLQSYLWCDYLWHLVLWFRMWTAGTQGKSSACCSSGCNLELLVRKGISIRKSSKHGAKSNIVPIWNAFTFCRVTLLVLTSSTSVLNVDC